MYQVFGTKKCKETQKVLRYFKERNIEYQFIDLNVKGLSEGELNNVLQFYTLDDIIDNNSKEYLKKNLKYIKHNQFQTVLEIPLILKTPIVRNNKKVQLGFKSNKLEI
ncbi:MAG: ArsC family transcriptional regulator [Candidatus Cloacimonetes bacterium]|jgi:arsenate reductase-like glutaredoxin family protein|nr:ArsC family transcriptional regulator [Candidatus Cloacimonadota bacterium]MDD4155281.1 ArsC family transcriptional regulator [Candidatus Cloacimonadota bacterium]